MRSTPLCHITLIAFSILLSVSSPSANESLRARAPGADPLALLDSLVTASSLEAAHAAVTKASDESIAAGDSAATCALLVTRGIAELRLQQHQTGLNTLTAAIEWSRATRDSVRWLYALDFSTVGLDALGQFDESLNTSRAMLELAIAARKPSHEAWARIGIAYAALISSQLEEALDGYSRAVELFRSDGNKRDELTALVGLGRTYARLGQIDEAKSCYHKVFLVATDIEAHSNAGHALNNLGVLEHQYGDISLAIGYFERARTHYETAGSPGGTITAAANIADGWMNLGRYGDAIEVLDTALELAQESGRRPDVGRLLSKLAWAHLEDHRPRRAERLFRMAHAMGDTLLDRFQTEATLGLAQSLEQDARSDEAIELLQRRVAREADSFQLASLHTLLARLHRRTGQRSEALRDAKEALRLSATFEGNLARDAIFLELSICHREAGELQLSADRFDEALDAIEQRRARISDGEWREVSAASLGSQLVDAAEIRHVFPTELAKEERDRHFYEVLKEFKSRTLMERIRADAPVTDDPRSAAEIQSEILSAGDLLIEFFVSDQRSWLFALTRDEFRVVPIPGSESELATRVGDYVSLLAVAPDAAARAADDFDRAQQSLGNALLGEVSGLVESARRIIVIPDGYLHSLPFGALSLHADGSPIVANREVYRVPSTSFLRVSGQSTPPTLPLTLVAIAGVDRDGSPLEGAEREVLALRRNFVHARVIERKLQAEALRSEFADAAVIHIAAHVDVNDEIPWHSGILLAVSENGPDPSDSTNETATTRGRRLSILSSEDSLRVRESLSGDHYLRAAEIADWELKADLAVLSGCESALGRVTNGEGVIGLGGAFLAAGARTVVATLWPVDDRFVGPLMQQFYAELAEGNSVSAALRGAQLEVRAHSDTRHPFYWAGFVVIGDGNATVPLEARSRNSRYPIAIAGTSILVWLILLGARRRKQRNDLDPGVIVHGP